MSDIRVIRDGQPQVVRIIDGQSQLVRVLSEGPPGPQGPPGVTQLNALQDVDATGLANRSMLVWDATQDRWVANNQTTVEEVLNGGNF
jgi:hypothetical protein